VTTFLAKMIEFLQFFFIVIDKKNAYAHQKKTIGDCDAHSFCGYSLGVYYSDHCLGNEIERRKEEYNDRLYRVPCVCNK
jgi:hypothetical protein